MRNAGLAAVAWGELSDPWRGCVELAWEAYCAGSLPIGAVAADSQSGADTRLEAFLVAVKAECQVRLKPEVFEQFLRP